MSSSINAASLEPLCMREAAGFLAAHPQCQAMAAVTAKHFLYGVPMHWMSDWSSPIPLFVREAHGARFTCVDGHEYADFCLGDTGAMFGHSPAPVARAIAAQAAKGLTVMLPSADAAEVGQLLAERFGLPFWQMATTATDANRFVLRWARAVTGRKTIVVFNGCYHGTVDDTFIDLVDGLPERRDSLLGQVYDVAEFTRVVEFNDLAGVEAALVDNQVACVITEPALTNIGMVLPQPGFLEGVRELTRRQGTLLVLDETHTISTGPGGAGCALGIEADFLVIGKPIAGGLPCAVYGFSAEMAERMRHAKDAAPPGHSGIGTTLSGNALSLAALRANLSEVMTPAAYRRMLPLAEQLADGLRAAIDHHDLPWCVTQIGARCEFQFRAQPPLNGHEAETAFDPLLERAIHLYLLNRGVMITPFHNMTLVCPETNGDDVDCLLVAFNACLDEIVHK
jgi:glutamate-1-semialdehyde 2,1-aminomutase